MVSAGAEVDKATLAETAAVLQELAKFATEDADALADDGYGRDAQEKRTEASVLNFLARTARNDGRTDSTKRSGSELAQFFKDAYTGLGQVKPVTSEGFNTVMGKTNFSAVTRKAARNAEKTRESQPGAFSAILQRSPLAMHTSYLNSAGAIVADPGDGRASALQYSADSRGFKTVGRRWPGGPGVTRELKIAEKETFAALRAFGRENPGGIDIYLDHDVLHFRVEPPRSHPGIDYSHRAGNMWAGQVRLSADDAAIMRRTLSSNNGPKAAIEVVDQVGLELFGKTIWRDGIGDKKIPPLGPRFAEWDPSTSNVRIAVDATIQHKAPDIVESKFPGGDDGWGALR